MGLRLEEGDFSCEPIAVSKDEHILACLNLKWQIKPMELLNFSILLLLCSYDLI